MEPFWRFLTRRLDPFCPLGPHLVQRSLPDGFQTSFFMLLGAFLDVFGAYFEGFWLDFGAFNLQKMPKTCQIFVAAAWDRLPQNFWGAAVTAGGVFDKNPKMSNKCDLATKPA